MTIQGLFNQRFKNRKSTLSMLRANKQQVIKITWTYYKRSHNNLMAVYPMLLIYQLIIDCKPISKIWQIIFSELTIKYIKCAKKAHF